MHLTSTAAALILAFTSSVLAAPGSFHERRQDSNQAPPADALSVTQKLLIAPLATDRFKILTKPEDFKFNLTPDDIPQGQGGSVKLANRNTFPALVGTNSAMAVGRIAPCGINTFHVHPRSAELQIVIEGSLVTEMVPENGADPIRNTVNKLEVTPFYQGSIHHQWNPTCEDALFVAALSNEDPGTGQVVNNIFKLDQNALEDTFGGTIPGDMIEKIKQNLPQSVVQGVRICNAKCNPQSQGNAEQPK